jgi:hypothetical protein
MHNSSSTRHVYYLQVHGFCEHVSWREHASLAVQTVRVVDRVHAVLALFSVVVSALRVVHTATLITRVLVGMGCSGALPGHAGRGWCIGALPGHAGRG